ncbi:hypothetical protein D3C84_882240 [compost metagenome]
MAQPHAHVHLGDLAQHVLGQLGQLGALGRAFGVQLAQRGQVAVHLLDRDVVGLAVGGFAREQEAALAGFGVQHVLQDLVERAADLLRLVDVRQGAARLPVSCLVDAHEGQCGQRREQEAHGHFLGG